MPLKTGIGLHYGSLVLGVIGDTLRMDTGVVSDTVNTSSRLEGLNKVFGTTAIVSEDVYKQLEHPEAFVHRFLGKVQVVGKMKALGIYDFFEAWKRSASETVSAKVFGLKQWFTASVESLAQKGFDVDRHKKWLGKGYLIWYL